MSSIFDCACAFEELLAYEYSFVLGHKGKSREIKLNFDKTHFYHLVGLQYLKDLRNLKIDREKVFEKIKARQFSQEFFESSVFYSSIAERISYFSYLEQLLDSNKTIFKYNSQNRQFSLLEADFLLKNDVLPRTIFVFICENKAEKGHYFCRSFFPENEIDYSKNQSSWTILYKTKKNLETGKEHVLFENPSFKKH